MRTNDHLPLYGKAELEKALREGGTLLLVSVESAEQPTLGTTNAIDTTAQGNRDETVNKLLEDFEDVFRDLPPHLPPQRAVSLRIDTGDTAPIAKRAYRLTPAEKQE